MNFNSRLQRKLPWTFDPAKRPVISISIYKVRTASAEGLLWVDSDHHHHSFFNDSLAPIVL